LVDCDGCDELLSGLPGFPPAPGFAFGPVLEVVVLELLPGLPPPGFEPELLDELVVVEVVEVEPSGVTPEVASVFDLPPGPCTLPRFGRPPLKPRPSDLGPAPFGFGPFELELGPLGFEPFELLESGPLGFEPFELLELGLLGFEPFGFALLPLPGVVLPSPG
jgi:hypothetical protein